MPDTCTILMIPRTPDWVAKGTIPGVVKFTMDIIKEEKVQIHYQSSN